LDGVDPHQFASGFVADTKRPDPKTRGMAKRGEAWGTSESRQMLEHAIETGRGGVYLRLTPEQYARLRR
jgi:hypothetical protein